MIWKPSATSHWVAKFSWVQKRPIRVLFCAGWIAVVTAEPERPGRVEDGQALLVDQQPIAGERLVIQRDRDELQPPTVEAQWRIWRSVVRTSQPHPAADDRTLGIKFEIQIDRLDLEFRRAIIREPMDHRRVDGQIPFPAAACTKWRLSPTPMSTPFI